MNEYRITLPLPPSVNNALIPVVIGWKGKKPIIRLVPSDEMKAWKKRARELVEAGPRPLIEGVVEFFVEFFVPSIASDCSNRVKPSEDILTGFAYPDDKQVAEGHSFKRIADIPENERCVIVVRPANPAEHPELVRRLNESFKRRIRKVAAELAPPHPVEQVDWFARDVELVESTPGPRHYIGDGCPGGHEKLADSRMRSLGPRRSLEELATSATHKAGP